jgi:1-acyl-sn-glycerol-3-phosphate acyltransferase
MKSIGTAIRSAFTWGTALPATFAIAAMLWVYSLFRPASPVLDALTRLWGRTCLRLAGVTLNVEGLEHVDKATSYVVVSNHVSGFDIMAHFAALPISIRFLAKTELFKIPIFGQAMRSIGIVEVDRDGGPSIHDHINTSATDAVAKGRSLIIYPEGTRPRDGNLQQFKKGAFTIATSMDLPILPTAITGSYEVWPADSKIIRPGTITVTVLPAIPTDELGPTEVEALRTQVHERIERVVSSR